MNAVDGDLFSFRVLNAEIEPELHHMSTIIVIITLAITTKEELCHTAIPSLDILREFYMCYFFKCYICSSGI